MRITPRAWCWIGVVGAGLVVLGAVLGWVVFPFAVNLVIGKELALKQGTEAWDRFVDLPISLDMKLSIFNVTNVAEIMKGAKPRLQELGPYVYKQHRHKVDLKYNAQDDTVSYRQKLVHFFDEEQSAPFKANDKVTVVNPALMSMLGIMQNIPVLSKGTMFVDAAAPLLFPEGLFMTTTADKLLFRGVRIPCGQIPPEQSSYKADALPGDIPIKPRLAALITCSSFKRIKVPSLKVTANGDVLFSLFGQKNDTDDGVYTVRTGITKPDKLGDITAWEGKSQVSAWGGPSCNTINGTQGDIFNPYLTKESTISVFSTDICRSMALKYLEDSSYRGISGYRFAPTWEVMASPEKNGNNYCFCPQVAKGLTKNNGCLKKGALDLSGCQGIPVIVTYPHFYEADPSYQNGVEGLNPQKELHRMQLDIEPMTGTPLLGGKKMQLNFEMKQVDGVKLTAGVRDTLFPVAWMYEGAQLNTELLNLLNGLLFSRLKILDGIKYTMLALGVVMFTSGTAMFTMLRMRRGAVRPESPPPSSRTPKPASPRTAQQAALPAGHRANNHSSPAGDLRGDVGLMPHHAPAANDTAETRLQAVVGV